MSSPDPLREIEDALSFPASPDFSARVRRRVATAPMRSRRFTRQDLAVAAAVILTAAAGLVASLSRDVELVQPARPVVVDRASPSVGPGVEPAPVVASVAASRRPAVVLVSGPVSPFETLVPDDQRRALDRLLASMRSGSATVPPSVLDEEVNEIGQRVPRALVIEPMKLELLPGMPGDPVKDPVKDPIK